MLKKCVSVALSALIIAGTSSVPLSANAAETEVLPSEAAVEQQPLGAEVDIETVGDTYTYGDFEYVISNGTIKITNYTGYAVNLTIPSSINGYKVTSIGNDAFYGKYFSSLTMPDSITSIGYEAFENCRNLKKIVLSNSLQFIDNLAFSNCVNLTDITLPNSITHLDYYCFSDCTSLTSIVFPKNDVEIYSYAFSGCTNLKAAVIPDSITVIQDLAFEDCPNLTIYGNKSNNAALSYAQKYDIPYEVIYNESESVYEYSDLSDNTVKITNYKGQNKAVVIPATLGGKTVTQIGNGAFKDHTAIDCIIIPDSITSIGSYTFYGCTNMTNINIPDSVTSIGNYTFYNCTNLTSIKIPDSVTSIGSYTFCDCSKLTSFSIPSYVTSIGDFVFCGCRSLTNISIPGSVVSIGNNAFESCTDLTSISIPKSVTSIGSYAFSNCYRLTDVNLPDYVTSIGNYAFRGCSSLTNISIPGSVASIGNNAFESCSNLTSISIPKSVTSIGSYAFSYCYGLKDVNIPDSVTSIGSYTFYNCKSLRTVNIPSSVTYIAENAFYNCTYLSDIYYSGSKKQWNNINIGTGNSSLSSAEIYYGQTDSPFDYDVLSDGTIEITKYNGTDRNVSVPSSIDGKSVTKFGSLTFSDCTFLEDVTIPATMTSVGYNTFISCTNLKNIYVPSDCNKYISIDGVLYSKNKATLICCPAAKTSVSLPDTLKTIGGFSFYGCSKLQSVTVPGSVTNILDHSFYECTSLKSVTIPYSVTSIGESAFYGCTNLTDVYYTGTPEQWRNINILSSNASLTNADIHYKLENNSKLPTVISLGNYIAMTGSASGGTEPYKYTYKYKKSSASTWNTLASNTTETSKSFKPGAATTYDIKVIVTDASGISKTKSAQCTVNAAFSNTSTLPTSTTLGNSIMMYGSAAGGIAPYKYTYKYKKSSASTWNTLASNTTETSKSFKPGAATTYDIKVIVTDASGISKTKSAQCTVNAALSNTSLLPTSITLGNSIMMYGSAAGGTAPYKYTYKYKKSSASTWNTLASNTTATSKSFKPGAATTYDIKVIVTDVSGISKTKSAQCTVSAAFSNTSTLPTSITLGNSITMKGSAAGGTAPYKYTYKYKKSSASTWNTLASNTTETSKSFKPGAAATYDIKVIVTDASGTSKTKSAQCVVSK